MTAPTALPGKDQDLEKDSRKERNGYTTNSHSAGLHYNSVNASRKAGCRTGNPKLDNFLGKMNRDMLRDGISQSDRGLTHTPIGSPKNYSVIKEAEICLMSGNNLGQKVTSKLGNLNYEKEYKIVFNELVANEANWMAFFDNSYNLVDINHVCGMLECLAMIYRSRRTVKSYVECGKVLDMFAKVLQKYEKAKATSPPFFGVTHYEEVYIKTEFNYNNIRCEQLTETKRFQEAVPYWRKCIEFEFYQCGGKLIPRLERTGSLSYLPYLEKYLSWDRNDITQQNVAARVSDKAITFMIKTQLKHDKRSMTQFVEKEKLLFVLKVCACCSKEESWMKEFKGCSKCGDVFYCGRDCQVQNWKKHKKVCASKK